MLPFQISIKPGTPVYEQILYAVKKALILGEIRPGDKFPSVRTLSQELRINPNTAHKVVAVLIQEKILSPQPGIGTLIMPLEPGNRRDNLALLGKDIEKLVVQAKQLKLELKDVTDSVHKHWEKLSQDTSQ